MARWCAAVLALAVLACSAGDDAESCPSGWCLVRIEAGVGDFFDASGVAEEIWASARRVDGDPPELSVMHFDGEQWARHDTDLSFGALWAAAPDELWLTSYGVLLRSSDDGATWSPFDLDSATGTTLDSVLAVFGSGTDDVWVAARPAAAADLLFHWDGVTWSQDDAGALLTTAHGARQGCSNDVDDVWLTGGYAHATGDPRGFLAHRDGSGWRLDTPPLSGAGTYYDVRCRAGDVWLRTTGDGPERLYRRRGTSWMLVDIDGGAEYDGFAPAGDGAGWLAGIGDSEVGFGTQVWRVENEDSSPTFPGGLDLPILERVRGAGFVDRIWSTDAGRVFAFALEGHILEYRE